MSKNKKLKTDDRFWQLHALAQDGDECAQADLWSEYEFTFGVDEAPVTNDRLIHAVLKATEEAKEQALPILEGRAEDPALLLMGEAAELLNVSRPTLWRMLKAGRLQKVELYPGAFRLRRSDILDLIAGGRDGSPSRPSSHSQPSTSDNSKGARRG